MADWHKSRLRKEDFLRRITLLREWKLISSQLDPFLLPSATVTAFSDAMIETAVGVFPLPLGLAENFLVDQRWLRIPMVTEEPSVIAAATVAAGVISRHGGISTKADLPIVIGQTVIIGVHSGVIPFLEQDEQELVHAINKEFPSMYQRGGGARNIRFRMIDEHSLSCDLYADTRDAMGANTVTRMLGSITPWLERITGGKRLFTVVSNHSSHRLYTAQCDIPFHALRRGGYAGEEMADRLVSASQIAFHDPLRAVTHNKGIMNGIHALALATGNDTRAIESAVHAYAAREGQYRGLGKYVKGERTLQVSLQLPLILATKGGATMHPVAVFSLDLLSKGWEGIDASRLGRTAVALGLAQNFAALMALTAEGILPGHMKKHERRIAWLNKRK